MKELKIGKYQHSKTGNMYRVVGIAKHSETHDDLVVYESLNENPLSKLWVRPKEKFLEEVDIKGKRCLDLLMSVINLVVISVV